MMWRSAGKWAIDKEASGPQHLGQHDAFQEQHKLSTEQTRVTDYIKINTILQGTPKTTQG